VLSVIGNTWPNERNERIEEEAKANRETKMTEHKVRFFSLKAGFRVFL
jgi:hypothetical protein